METRKSLDDLLNNGVIEPFVSTNNKIANEWDLAKNELYAARKMLLDDDLLSWAYRAAYNAMLQASRTLMMFNDGYRSKSGSSSPHVAVVQFIKSQYSDRIDLQALATFNNARRIRHSLMYDEVGSTTKDDAQKLIASAEILIRDVSSILNLPR